MPDKDKKLLETIKKNLVEFGVDKEKAHECYDAIRFYCEARAVLLNRLSEPKERTGYYTSYLKKLD